jgi:hypothetical protein
MQTQIALSADAVAVLRFEIKGMHAKKKEGRLPAYRELAAAGIMEPVPGSEVEYRFTAEGWERREEILGAGVAHLHRLEPRLPDRIELSESALSLLRERLKTRDNRVDDSNREAYRELVRAGIMFAVSGFVGGPEASFRFTDEGWARREELTVSCSLACPLQRCPCLFLLEDLQRREMSAGERPAVVFNEGEPAATQVFAPVVGMAKVYDV